MPCICILHFTHQHFIIHVTLTFDKIEINYTHIVYRCDRSDLFNPVSNYGSGKKNLIMRVR